MAILRNRKEAVRNIAGIVDFYRKNILFLYRRRKNPPTKEDENFQEPDKQDGRKRKPSDLPSCQTVQNGDSLCIGFDQTIYIELNLVVLISGGFNVEVVCDCALIDLGCETLQIAPNDGG